MSQLKLNKLERTKAKRKRVGRGGSRGGTSGRGHNGQKSRSGSKKLPPGFEGGQMPLHRRVPKRGFTNARFKQEVKIINLQSLNDLFEDGAIVNRSVLVEKNIIKGRASFILKVLGNGELSKKLIVEADSFSKFAAKAIQSQGGEVRLTRES